MNADELVELDGRLRRFATARGMEWVVDELDDAIATGVFEPRELRQSSRQGRITYDDVPSIPQGGRKRAEEFVGRRSLTLEEQIRLLLSGLRRVLVDLDRVAAAAVLDLNDFTSITQSADDVDVTEPVQAAQRPLPVVTEIDFAPDEGSTASGVSTEGLRHAGRSDDIATVLRLIEAEVYS